MEGDGWAVGGGGEERGPSGEGGAVGELVLGLFPVVREEEWFLVGAGCVSVSSL